MSHPAMQWLGGMLVIAAFAGLIALDISKDAGELDDLVVADPAVRITVVDDTVYAHCFGRLANTGDRRWRCISLEARFNDAEGQALQIEHQRHNFAVDAGRTAELDLVGVATAAPETYVGCTLAVLDGRCN